MKRDRSLLRIVAALIGSIGRCAAQDDDCNCFLTNGSKPTFYSEHMFFDFRDLAEFAGVPDAITNATSASLAPPSSEYFESDDWTDVWELQSWDNSIGRDGELSYGDTVPMTNTLNNVFLESNDDDDAGSDTFMTMRTKRLPEFQSAAEFGSADNYLYVSLRMLSRTIGAPGAVTAMFTYRDSEELAEVQESDIEILTGGSRDIIHYTNQPSYNLEGETFPEATRNATVPRGREWSEWMVHRLDWTPDGCVWYVDGEETATIDYQTPSDPSKIIFNVWSNGGPWTGNMSTYDEAYLQIQWIEMVYNSTGEDSSSEKRSEKDGDLNRGFMRRDGDGDEGSCNRVCSIDMTDEPGAATMLWDNPAPRPCHHNWLRSGWHGLWTWAGCVSFLCLVL